MDNFIMQYNYWNAKYEKLRENNINNVMESNILEIAKNKTNTNHCIEQMCEVSKNVCLEYSISLTDFIRCTIEFKK